jgi:hypothetical protein
MQRSFSLTSYKSKNHFSSDHPSFSIRSLIALLTIACRRSSVEAALFHSFRSFSRSRYLGRFVTITVQISLETIQIAVTRNGRIAIKMIQLMIVTTVCTGCRPEEFGIGAISLGMPCRCKLQVPSYLYIRVSTRDPFEGTTHYR